MVYMMDTKDAMAAFLASGGKITQCPPTKKQARSLRSMRRDEEKRIEELMLADTHNDQ
jgi:hypothetical protein